MAAPSSQKVTLLRRPAPGPCHFAVCVAGRRSPLTMSLPISPATGPVVVSVLKQFCSPGPMSEEKRLAAEYDVTVCAIGAAGGFTPVVTLAEPFAPTSMGFPDGTATDVIYDLLVFPGDIAAADAAEARFPGAGLCLRLMMPGSPAAFSDVFITEIYNQAIEHTPTSLHFDSVEDLACGAGVDPGHGACRAHLVAAIQVPRAVKVSVGWLAERVLLVHQRRAAVPAMGYPPVYEIPVATRCAALHPAVLARVYVSAALRSGPDGGVELVCGLEPQISWREPDEPCPALDLGDWKDTSCVGCGAPLVCAAADPAQKIPAPVVAAGAAYGMRPEETQEALVRFGAGRDPGTIAGTLADPEDRAAATAALEKIIAALIAERPGK